MDRNVNILAQNSLYRSAQGCSQASSVRATATYPSIASPFQSNRPTAIGAPSIFASAPPGNKARVGVPLSIIRQNTSSQAHCASPTDETILMTSSFNPMAVSQACGSEVANDFWQKALESNSGVVKRTMGNVESVMTEVLRCQRDLLEEIRALRANLGETAASIGVAPPQTSFLQPIIRVDEAPTTLPLEEGAEVSDPLNCRPDFATEMLKLAREYVDLKRKEVEQTHCCCCKRHPNREYKGLHRSSVQRALRARKVADDSRSPAAAEVGDCETPNNSCTTVDDKLESTPEGVSEHAAPEAEEESVW